MHYLSSTIKNSGFTYDAPETEQPAPSNVSVKLSNTGFNKATITWDDNSSVETGYIIEVAESGTNDFTAIAGVKANTTSYTLINFDNSKDYVFRIKHLIRKLITLQYLLLHDYQKIVLTLISTNVNPRRRQIPSSIM